MSVRTDKVQLIVDIKGNEALNKLNDLKKQAADIKAEMGGLKKNTAEYMAKAKELAAVNRQMDDLKKTIGVAALSQKELTNELRRLMAIRNSVAPFSKEFKELDKQIKAVKDRLYDVKNGVQGFSSFWSKINDQVKQFGIVAAGYLGFQFITSQFQNIITGAAKMSDQLADLQRVAGLTAGEAKNLNSQLIEIDTRTSVSGLREIAIVAGKLGVAKDDLFEFTKAVDQLVVALGDELGDAGAITDKLGKILSVFDGKIDGDNITRLGNAFVELANTGAASGAFIADFDQRLSGIAKSAGIGLGELSGLGAGIEELGGRVESSSTAIQKLIISISEDIPKAAKIAGMDVKEFNELFAKNPTEALLRYSQGLVKNKQSFSEVTSAFKDAGEEGARTIETITKLGTSADYLRGRIELGKKSMQESTAITEAFRIKNETFGATVDKLGKAFNKFVSNSVLTNFLQSLLQGITKLITPAETLTDAFRKQQSIVNKLETDTLPLIKRYEELKLKSSLNKDEQIELNNAIVTIGKTIPTAITQFDKYGNALSINAVKAREFIELQKSILKEKNRDAIKDQDDLLKSLERTAAATQRLLNAGKVEQTVSGGSAGGTTFLRDLTGEEIQKAQENLAQLQERIKGVRGIIAELKGDNINIPDPAKSTDGNQPPPPPAAESEEAKKERERRRKEAEAERKRLLKEYEKFQDDILKLKERALIKGEEPDQQEVEAAKAKYAELLARLQEFLNKQIIDSKQFAGDRKLLEEALQLEILNIRRKYFEKGSEEQYKESLSEVESFLDEQGRVYAKAYANGQITEQEYQDSLTQLERTGLEMRLKTAQNFAEYSKEAKDDVAKYSSSLEKWITNNLIEEVKRRKALANEEVLARAKRDVITSAPGTDARFEAQKKLLELQFQQETEFLDKKSELYLLKEAELNQALNELQQQRNQEQIAQIEEYLGYVGQAYQAILQSLANRENMDLARDKKANEQKKSNYKKQLDEKLISKEQHDKKVADADAQMDQKERQLRRKQAEREKAMNLFQAFINNASAILKTMTSVPYPLNIPLAIAQGIAGGLQIQAIANTELPELEKGRWVRDGKRHSQGGIMAEIEKDEAVMSRRAMLNNDVVTVTGTTAQITSALNSRAGGASWAGGAVVQMPRWTSAAPPAINPSLPSIMEGGGRFRDGKAAVNRTDDGPAVSNELLRQVVASQLQTAEEIRTMKRELKAVVVYKEITDAGDRLDAAKKAGAL